MTFEWIIPVAGCALFGVVAAALLVSQALRDGAAHRLVWGRRMVMAGLIIVMGMTPSIPQTTTTLVGALNVVIVVDRTTSMTAIDMPGEISRLDAARADLRTIASSLAGARFEVLTVSRTSRKELPWTTDAGAVIAYADALTPEIAYSAAGTSIDAPGLHADLDARSASRKGGRSVLVLLTDGEGTQEDSSSPSYNARAYSGGLILSYGTRAGATMRPYLGGGRYDTHPVVDPGTGAPAVTHADPDALARLAKRLNMACVNRGAGEDLTRALTRLRGGSGETLDADIVVPRHIIWPFVWVFVILAAWELYDQARIVRIHRDQARLVASNAGRLRP